MNQQVSDNLLAQFTKQLFIPHKVFSPIISQSYEKDLKGLYKNIVQQGEYAKRNQVINGELVPIFIIFSYIGNQDIEVLKQLIDGIIFKVNYTKKTDDQGQTKIPTFCRFLDSFVTIDSQFVYSQDKYQIDENEKQIIFCKTIPINMDQELNNSVIDLVISIEYEDNSTNKWVNDKEKLYSNLLKNNLTIPKPQKQQFELSEEISLLHSIQLTYSLQETDNTDFAHINYAVRCLKSMVQVSTQLQEFVKQLSKTYDIEINKPAYEIHNIELVLSKSSLQWADQKLNLFKQAPFSILKHIQIKKVYNEKLPSIFEPEEESEGFFQLSVDWQTILWTEAEVQIPVVNRGQRRTSVSSQMTNPQLLICSPFLIRWKFKDELYFTNSIFKINWQVQPVAELGAKVKEVITVVRYKQEGNEYLAIKLMILNYSTQSLNVTMNIQPEIFGQRFRKTANQSEPLQVLAVCLTTKQDVGIINPCSNVDTLVRLRLINRGILHINQLQFNDKQSERVIEVKMNFLHSYEQ